MHRRLWVLGIALLCAAFQPPAAPSVAFIVTFDPQLSREPFTGRVFVFLGKAGQREPRNGPNWFKPDPFFAVDVKGWQPSTPLHVGREALGLPGPMDKLPAGSYAVQAVMDFDLGSRNVGTGPGNGYGPAVTADLDPARGWSVALKVDQRVPDRPFRETDRIKLVDVESPRLTAFHGRPIHLRAGVILPESFAKEPGRKYPVVYEIPGFGGTHHQATAVASRNANYGLCKDMVHVVLDPECRTGHHVFADSANNGPYGAALVEELIPHLEKKYRCIGQPWARFVTGHSSGGWSSLWLQVAYPDTFGGVWSLSPDPVDFRDFQRINVYAPGENTFKDAKGQDRPLGRRGDQIILYFKPFSDMEHVLGRGGQLGSFEAVFSPRGPDGRPRRLWDRTTGAIDPAVARTWEAYDINLVLKRGWPTLGPKLRGKLHVITGELDTFYLEGAVRLLGQTLRELGSDAVVEIHPGKDHGTILTADLYRRIDREMQEVVKRQGGRG